MSGLLSKLALLRPARTMFLAGSIALLLAAAQPTHAAEPDPADKQDFDFASRGFIATRTDPLIRGDDGEIIRDLKGTAFIDGPPSPYINPSLQRQAQLLSKSGLFQVRDGVWQVRGFDVSNITFIRGKRGWVVIDPLTSEEEARAALDLVTERLGRRPITAVLYTHSHIDHFGGAKGIIDQKDVDSGKVEVIAPSGFMDSVMREWVIAGNAMYRRGSYQAGTSLALDPKGNVSFGIGQGDGATKGQPHRSLIPPNVTIEKTLTERTVDGVRIVFQLTLGTEAPSEMNMFFPDLHVLDLAENANATMHNILTPRGAEVRSAKDWADDLTESQRLFGAQTDALIVSHSWPRFGNAAINDYLGKHRDAYKYLHDQTVRMMNKGLVGSEIANRLKLPDVLAREWYNRGYYGSLSFNVRAVYQRYMGWYDGNPAHLEPLEPADEARRYIAAIGGRGKVFALAAKSQANGDDIWAVQLLNHLVMNDAHDQAARDALAQSYERLAYAQENSLWRNMYLSAALELRVGLKQANSQPTNAVGAFAEQMPTANILDLYSVRLDPDKVGTAAAMVDVTFPERKETFRIMVRNDVLTYEASPTTGHADVTATMPRASFMKFMASGQLDPNATIVGPTDLLSTFRGWFEAPPPVFPLVWRAN
jgi:alkyl sulfatase BDS1-like metallo-beta-lactamase superfamily hydrolase